MSFGAGTGAATGFGAFGASTAAAGPARSPPTMAEQDAVMHRLCRSDATDC